MVKAIRPTSPTAAISVSLLLHLFLPPSCLVSDKSSMFAVTSSKVKNQPTSLLQPIS